jgi:hypothetical protein
VTRRHARGGGGAFSNNRGASDLQISQKKPIFAPQNVPDTPRGLQMKIAVFLAAVTIGLSFAIGVVASSYGPKVEARFLERGDKIKAADLKKFIVDFQNEARGYVCPILFPLDLMFMLCLGGFLLFASVSAGESIECLRKVAWIFAIGPLLYVAVDLVEDICIARMLLSVDDVSQSVVDTAGNITTVKVVIVAFSILQTIVLSGIAAIVVR